MTYIVDRRLNSKNKSLVNRERFLKRYQNQIRKAVSDAVSRRNITDMEQKVLRSPSVIFPNRCFGTGKADNAKSCIRVIKSLVTGDKLPRPYKAARAAKVRDKPRRTVTAKTILSFKSPNKNFWNTCLKI